MFKELSKKDSIYKRNLLTIKSKVDSLIQLYFLSFEEEKLSVLSQINSNEYNCLSDLKKNLVNNFVKLEEKAFKVANEKYFDRTPNRWNIVKYNYNLMKRFPSVQYANRITNLKIECEEINYKFQNENFKYLEFEKQLNEIVITSETYGTIFYNKSSYDEKYKKIGLLNMLLYYVD